MWPQVPEPSTSVADHLTDGDRLVGAEIIHHDDVAGFEHRYELLLDIGAKHSPLIGPSKTQGAVSRSQRGGRPSSQARQNRSNDNAATTLPLKTRQYRTAPQPTGSSHGLRLQQQHAHEDHWKEVASFDAGLHSSQHLESQNTQNGIPADSTKSGYALSKTNQSFAYRG